MKHERWNGFCRRHFSPLAIAGMAIGGLSLAVIFAFLFGWAVMLLWNALMPTIFGLPEISYWQGWGLVLLAHILVKGGWGNSGSGCDDRRGSGGNRRDDQRCEVCETCDYTEKCRPYANGWIRTANGWKRDVDTVKKDVAERVNREDEGSSSNREP